MRRWRGWSKRESKIERKRKTKEKIKEMMRLKKRRMGNR
jgi:hypothetical protein